MTEVALADVSSLLLPLTRTLPKYVSNPGQPYTGTHLCKVQLLFGEGAENCMGYNQGRQEGAENRDDLPDTQQHDHCPELQAKSCVSYSEPLQVIGHLLPSPRNNLVCFFGTQPHPSSGLNPPLIHHALFEYSHDRFVSNFTNRSTGVQRPM